MYELYKGYKDTRNKRMGIKHGKRKQFVLRKMHLYSFEV